MVFVKDAARYVTCLPYQTPLKSDIKGNERNFKG